MAFLVDPTLFQAEGAVINWAQVAGRLGLFNVAGVPRDQLLPVLQLRWMFRDVMGMPTEPFIVWRRHRKERKPKPLELDISPLNILFGAHLVDWHDTMSLVEVDVDGAAGLLFAFAGSPLLSQVVAFAGAPGGPATLTLTAPIMDGLLASAGVVVKKVRGLPSDDLSQAAGWEKLELVGLPVPKPEWNGINHHAADQGMITALTTPKDAARQRLERGAPPVGWGALLQTGFPAPIWTSPNFLQLIEEVNDSPLAALKGVLAAFPPNQQAGQQVQVPMPPPENSSGQSMSVPGGTSQISPLGVTLMGAGSDPHLSLTLGFGTAYPVVPSHTLAAVALPGQLDFDYMVTARWEKGLDGNSPAVEYAAPVPTPQLAVAPPAPANLVSELMGHLRPLQGDQDWRCTVRVSWDRPIAIPLFRARTYAFARAGIAPPAPAVALLEPRKSGGYRPITINTTLNSPDEEDWRLHAVDRELPIPSNPGTRSLKYGAAHQDLYGQWSGWSALNATVQQPPVDQVRIVSAELRALMPPVSGAICNGTLTIEFLWDWRIRSPDVIRFAGRLYAAANHGDPPPNTSVPAGLQKSLGGGFPAFDIAFTGDAPTNASLNVKALNQAGDAQVTFGPAQGNEARRYRVTIPGFSLNFGGTGHIGLALWAQARERIPPQRTGNWSSEPSVVSVSDPRPPVIPPDIVTLASLPDASGECHARLGWSASPGAAGYFIYESTETKILLANSLAEAPPDMTLSQRLTRIKNAFKSNPSRREFTRRNARLIQGSSADITLPRGATSIHVFIVLGVNAGQVEAEWPGGPDPDDMLQAFAAPRVQVPAMPTLEVQSFFDETVPPGNYRAKVRIGTRTGARVKRLDLHRVRVDDAARQLDSMGPPVQSINSSSAGWTTSEVTDTMGTHLVSALGVDTPNGSWKRVWYRATAWSDKDDLRGTLAGRSPASSVAWVVVPPNTPPDLSAVISDWPAGGAPADVLLKWSSSAPIRKTPLGPHLMTVRARLVGAAPGVEPLIAVDQPLDQLPTAEPATGSGVWRAGTTKPVPYRALIRRAALTDSVLCAIRITDPLGRVSEQLVTIAPGPVLPDPVLENFLVTPSVTPPGVTVSWTSNAPIEAGDAGAYQLRVTVLRPPKQLFPPFGPWVSQPPIVLEMGLDDVPLDEPGPVPPGVDPLRVRRMPGGGPDHSYYAFSRVPTTAMVVRLAAPDGRVAEHTQPVT